MHCISRRNEFFPRREKGIIPVGLDKHTVLSEETCRNLPHVTICLLGKFKGEIGVDHHLITVANEIWSEAMVVAGKADRGV
jgi:hypothetical protein